VRVSTARSEGVPDLKTYAGSVISLGHSTIGLGSRRVIRALYVCQVTAHIAVPFVQRQRMGRTAVRA
jgi:hypothetical protein